MSIVFFSEASYASRARLLVLGDGSGGQLLNNFNGGGNSGSLIYDDPYSIFYNPALLSDHLNWAVVEKSNGKGSAQGGFTTSILNFKTAVYFNRPIEGTYGSTIAPVDFLIAADMGVKWGLGFTYGRADDSNKYIGFRLGFSYLGFEPFLNTTLQGSSTSGKNSNIFTGLRYQLGEWTPYFAFRSDKVGSSDSGSNQVVGFGVGRHFDVAEGVKMNWSLSYFNKKTGSSSASHVFPFELSVEAEAASWLTIRGGFSYKKSNSSARIGAGIYVGKATFDWVVGGSTGSEDLDSTSFGFDSSFFSAASLSYEW